MSDLSPEARALLAAAADGDDPTPADRDRIARALAVPLGITALLPATAQAAGAAVGTGLTVSKALAAGALLLTFGGAAAVGARRASPRAVTTAVTARAPAASPAARPSAAVQPAPARATAPSPPAVAVAQPEPAVAPSPPRRTRVQPGVEEDSLRAESELLAAAHRSLARGDAPGALARIADYDTRFPRGTLREERDLERALALCAAGRVEESRAAAQRFLRAYPDSPSAGRAASACANPSREPGPTGTVPAGAAAADGQAE